MGVAEGMEISFTAFNFLCDLKSLGFCMKLCSYSVDQFYVFNYCIS